MASSAQSLGVEILDRLHSPLEGVLERHTTELLRWRTDLGRPRFAGMSTGTTSDQRKGGPSPALTPSRAVSCVQLHPGRFRASSAVCADYVPKSGVTYRPAGAWPRAASMSLRFTASPSSRHFASVLSSTFTKLPAIRQPWWGPSSAEPGGQRHAASVVRRAGKRRRMHLSLPRRPLPPLKSRRRTTSSRCHRSRRC